MAKAAEKIREVPGLMGNTFFAPSLLHFPPTRTFDICARAHARKNGMSKSRELCDSHMGHMSVGKRLLICVFLSKMWEKKNNNKKLCFLSLCVCVCLCACASECGGDIDLSLREKSSLFVN